MKTYTGRTSMYTFDRHRGFTLIELMIVVTIVAILAAIAYPSYQEQVRRTNRSEAQQLLINIANRQEQYLMDARAYGTLAQLGMTVPDRVNQFYTIEVDPNNAVPPSFTLRAAPRAGTTQESDGPLGLTSSGVKTPADKWK